MLIKIVLNGVYNKRGFTNKVKVQEKINVLKNEICIIN